MLTFQEIILRLTTFWSQQHCIIHQGHDVEVGAGTFNPATFLRCLGPEHYKAAYVEPSRRPSDGRYGENPNRLQLFHQFQVILKPSPPDVLPLYIASLEALGLQCKKHDIRFVHDDWESPTLGAWGLGWEVWCDGMEITQFTYFQAMGSLSLNPISAEITYGLERLALFIQNKNSIYDLQWNDELTFGELCKMQEIEWSTYNFETASLSLWQQHFEDFEQEAKTLIAKHLPLPAYDFVMKASHAFNMLQARGAISVTERTSYIARIRELSRLIASAYIASREKLGFPLLKPVKPKKTAPLKKVSVSFSSKKTQDFLLEIGSEPLPASFVPGALVQLEKKIKDLLGERALSYKEISAFGTPRRLSVLIKGLQEGTAPKESERRGPPVSAASQGFLKSVGYPEATLEEIRKGAYKDLRIDIFKGAEYLFATIKEASLSTFSLLQEALPSLISHLEFPKTMHWDDSGVRYARPLRWIVALWGSRVIPFCVGSIHSGKLSRGHAQRGSTPVPIPSPQEYLKKLKSHFVLACPKERKSAIEKQLRSFEKRGKILEREKVLSQVLYLTEWPQLMRATFDSRFLEAPPEVLIAEMVEHQKYFPLATRAGRLDNAFLITADNTPNDKIRQGNERVLSARLADGVFLYTQDVKVPLEEWNKKLSQMTYHKQLGSMWDKVLRLQQIAEVVRSHLKIGNKERVARAALLSKADLASALVGEFPELQGTIGGYYARAQREETEVAAALEEQWMPRFEGAPLPATETGMILSLADKLDNLLGSFSIGLKPTSSSDPYALRRQTIGILKILLHHKQRAHLPTLLAACAPFFPTRIDLTEILSFITARALNVFEDVGFKKAEIEACLQGRCDDPYDQKCKIEALHALRGPAFATLIEVYKRAKGQLTQRSPTPFNPHLLQAPAEHALFKALQEIEQVWSTLDYPSAFRSIARLQPPLSRLFDEVKILCDDLPLQHNRIALLQKIFDLFKELIDFNSLQEG